MSLVLDRAHVTCQGTRVVFSLSSPMLRLFHQAFTRKVRMERSAHSSPKCLKEGSGRGCRASREGRSYGVRREDARRAFFPSRPLSLTTGSAHLGRAHQSPWVREQGRK